MDINNITIKNKIDQKRVFNEFIKYCKSYGISTNEHGQQIVNVTNGENNYAMVVKFTPKEAKLGELDTIVVQGLAPYNYSLEELLTIGTQMLGADAFRTKEEIESMQQDATHLEVISSGRSR